MYKVKCFLFLGNVASEYKEFSEWYLKTFSQAILTSILRVLVAYQQNVYVSPRVMQLALNYVNTGVSHALTWKLIKPHILVSIFFYLFVLCQLRSFLLKKVSRNYSLHKLVWQSSTNNIYSSAIIVFCVHQLSINSCCLQAQT